MDLKFNKKAPRKPLGGQMTKLKETESDDKMKFKEEDIVRLKHPTEEDKQNAKLKYYDTFKKFEGLTATVLQLTSAGNYTIRIDDAQKSVYTYDKNWLESIVEYNAF